MSEITKEERAQWRELVMPYPDGRIGNQDKRMLRLLDALDAAEARVKARNKHIHTLMCEALENERKFDGMKSQWQTAEAQVARLIKERDWLAKALVERGHFIGNISSKSFADNWKESARKAVEGEA